MCRYLPCIAFTIGLLIANNCLGQCRSSIRYNPSPANLYPVRPATLKVAGNFRTTAIPHQSPVRSQATPQVDPAGAASPANPGVPQGTVAQAPTADSAALDPAQIKQVANGGSLRIATETGRWPSGMAILNVNGISMLIEPQQWRNNMVEVKLPQMLIKQPIAARLFIAANPETLLAEMEFSIQP